MTVHDAEVFVDDVIEHFGVKGMKWGVRNDDSAGVHRLQGSGPVIDPTLHKSTQTAGKQVAALMSERYGFDITAINAIPKDHPEYAAGTIGYVESTPGKRGGVVYARPTDERKSLKYAEDVGWFGEGTGNVQGFLTHESAHAVFHADMEVKSGLFGSKRVGSHMQARDKALLAAQNAARSQGIQPHEFTSRISGYAGASNTRQEAEAELFAQYHWSPNPPLFVKTWGETLHREMGVDSMPFREAVTRG